MKPFIIVPMYNVESWIQHNLEMLKKQVYREFYCILIDDMSTDSTVRKVQNEIAGDPRFELVVNKIRKFALRNIYEGISALNVGDEDVLILIDGDDSLLHSKALSHLMEAYESEDCWLTYGSYEDALGRRGDICKMYPDQIVAKNKFRKYSFQGAHPRSFKAKLWRQIHEDSFCATPSELDAVRKRALLKGCFRTWYYWKNIVPADIHDESGRFFRRCYDKTILYPMFEMAGNHASFIEPPLYRYNGSSLPLPYDKNKIYLSKWLTRCIRSIVIAKPRYDRISL